MVIRLHTTTTCRQLGNDTTYDTEKKDPTSHGQHVGHVGPTCREDTTPCRQNQLRTTSKTATFPAKQCSKVTNKAAYLGLEAIMAIWMSNKLPGMCIEEGHCFNDACCGCRFWGQGGFNDNLTYVSFEKVEGDFLRIVVHPEFLHINHTYGYNDTSFTSSMNFFYLKHDSQYSVYPA